MIEMIMYMAGTYNKIIILLIILALSLCSLYAKADNNNNINQYYYSTRSTTGELIYKEHIYNANIEQILSLIEDYDSYIRYFHHIKKSKKISVLNNNVIAYFMFEVFGRNFFARVNLLKYENISKDGNRIIFIRVHPIETNLRIMKGEWIIQQVDNNRTRLIIHGNAKPRLPLPDSFLQKIIMKEIDAAFNKLETILKDRNRLINHH